MSIAFKAEVTVTQHIQIVNEDYTTEDIVAGLRACTLETTMDIHSNEPAIYKTDDDSDEIIARIVGQDLYNEDLYSFKIED